MENRRAAPRTAATARLSNTEGQAMIVALLNQKGGVGKTTLADQPLPALRAEVHQRIVFADSVAAGRLASETAPDSAAAREVTALVDELLRWPS